MGARSEGATAAEGSGPSSDKAAARAQARAHRTQLRNYQHVFPPKQLRSSALAAVLDRAAQPRRRIAAYSSYGTEPDTTALIADLLAEGVEVLLPRIDGDDLAWIAVTADTDYEINDRGIREPRGDDRGLVDVDVVLVPALAVTRSGDRLGQGAGFYDRALADVPRANQGGPLLVAVVYADELLDEPAWPVEPHDIRMDDAITIE